MSLKAPFKLIKLFHQIPQIASLCSPPQLLPWEICDRILDHFFDDAPSLRICSLVCHAWLPTCRLHLFRTIAIGIDEFDAATINAVFSRRSSIRPYVQEILFRPDENYKRRHTSAKQSFFYYLPHRRPTYTMQADTFPNLKHLGICDLWWFSQKMSALLDGILPVVETLTFTGELQGDRFFDMVTKATNLHELSFRESAMATSLQRRPRLAALSPQLHTLRCNPGFPETTIDYILQWLVRSQLFQTLHTIELYSFQGKLEPFPASLFESAGVAIQHVILPVSPFVALSNSGLSDDRHIREMRFGHNTAIHTVTFRRCKPKMHGVVSKILQQIPTSSLKRIIIECSGSEFAEKDVIHSGHDLLELFINPRSAFSLRGIVLCFNKLVQHSELYEALAAEYGLLQAQQRLEFGFH